MARPLLSRLPFLLVMTATVDSARHDWAEGYRRFGELERRAGGADTLRRGLDLVLDGLRRRLGGAFSLAELAETYADAERWVRAAFEEHLPPGWAADLTTVEDAAFHLFSRSARDYAP